MVTLYAKSYPAIMQGCCSSKENQGSECWAISEEEFSGQELKGPRKLKTVKVFLHCLWLRASTFVSVTLSGYLRIIFD